MGRLFRQEEKHDHLGPVDWIPTKVKSPRRKVKGLFWKNDFKLTRITFRRCDLPSGMNIQIYLYFFVVCRPSKYDP